MKTKIFITFFLSFLIGSSFAATNNSTSVKEYSLSNGLKIIVKEDHRAPVVVSEVWYKVGSINEKNGLTGISHALEHMMFEGSKNFPDKTYLKTVSNNGGQFNAETASDYTYYYEIFSADKLPLAFKLEADRMHNLILSQKAFANEIQVVKEERRMRVDDNPQANLQERLQASAFIASPYHHPVIGWMRDLNAMNVQDLRAWYQAWYAPNNAILVVVGDVNPDNVYQLAQQYFGAIPAKKLQEVKPANDIPPLGKRSITVKLPAQLPTLIMAYNVPSVVTAKQPWQAYALLMLENILGGTDSSRLQTNLVRGQQIAASASSEYDIYAKLSTLFYIFGIPNKNSTLAQLQKAFQEEIIKLKTTPVSDEELNRVKTQFIAQQVYAEDSMETQASEIGNWEVIGLGWQENDNLIKQTQKITPQQIQEVAKTFLTTKRLTVGKLIPLPTKNNTNSANSGLSGGNNVH